MARYRSRSRANPAYLRPRSMRRRRSRSRAVGKQGSAQRKFKQAVRSFARMRASNPRGSAKKQRKMAFQQAFGK